ncbi:MAG: hypothetical protein ACJ78X_17340 [Myxococcales bacterium]|jgi:hypothetical protein
MEFTVELRYQSGSQTVLSIDAETADEALAEVRDERRRLVGIHITAPSQRDSDPEARSESTRGNTPTYRHVPVQHRPSRRHH